MLKSPHLQKRTENTRFRRQRWIKDFNRLFGKGLRQGLRQELVLEQLSRNYGAAPSTIWRAIKKQLTKEPK